MISANMRGVKIRGHWDLEKARIVGQGFVYLVAICCVALLCALFAIEQNNTPPIFRKLVALANTSLRKDKVFHVDCWMSFRFLTTAKRIYRSRGKCFAKFGLLTAMVNAEIQVVVGSKVK